MAIFSVIAIVFACWTPGQFKKRVFIGHKTCVMLNRGQPGFDQAYSGRRLSTGYELFAMYSKGTTMTGYSEHPGEVRLARTPRTTRDEDIQLVFSGCDFRLSKIIAARNAMRTAKYDTQAVLDETVRRLTSDLGLAVGS